MDLLQEVEVLIVGAGLAGLAAGQALRAAGRRVLLVEKSRGVGGRMATKRDGAASFDSGAQYFTARDTGHFAERVAAWQAAGALRPWFHQLPGDTRPAEPRYIGLPGMTAPAKLLAEGLEVLRESRVASLAWDGTAWTVTLEYQSAPIRARAVLLTAPLPQSLELLDAVAWPSAVVAPDLAAYRAVRYDRCLAVLALLEGPSQLPAPGCQSLPGGEPLRWLADNQQKGISAQPCATLHSSPNYAVEHWDSPDAVRLPPLLAAAAPHLGVGVARATIHRWRYAQVRQPLAETHALWPGLRLALAGDAFGGSRVEAAALSGFAAGAALGQTLSP